MRTFVTGGSGFIGTNVVERLRMTGDEVLNYDLAPPRNPEHGAVWSRGDVLDPSGLKSALRAFCPDRVIHLAARTDLAGREPADYPANVAGVRNLIDAVDACGTVSRTVMASSMLVCRLGYMPTAPDDYAPSTPYGESKMMGERIVREADPDGRRFVLFRPTSIWGPWFHHPYRAFFEAVAKRRYVHPGTRRPLRSYGYVGNAVSQILALTDVPSTALGPGPYYLADYEPVEIKVWADEISAALGLPAPPSAPLWVFKAAATLGDLASGIGLRGAPVTSFRLNNMLTSAVYDCEPMRALCPSLPYSRQAGIAQTLSWMKTE